MLIFVVGCSVFTKNIKDAGDCGFFYQHNGRLNSSLLFRDLWLLSLGYNCLSLEQEKRISQSMAMGQNNPGDFPQWQSSFWSSRLCFWGFFYFSLTIVSFIVRKIARMFGHKHLATIKLYSKSTFKILTFCVLIISLIKFFVLFPVLFYLLCGRLKCHRDDSGASY